MEHPTEINEETTFARVVLSAGQVWDGDFRIMKGKGALSDVLLVGGVAVAKVKNKEGEIEEIERFIAFPFESVSEFIY